MGRLRSIDALRGFAALFVFVHHWLSDSVKLLPRTNLLYWLGYPSILGYTGVHLFLVISGFCIHFRSARADSSQIDYVAFWKRRFQRLYPSYLVALILAVTIGVATAVVHYRTRAGAPLPWPPPPYATTGLFLGDIATHLVMIHIFWSAFHGGAYDPSMWSLALEEQLYALYAGFLSLRRRWPAATVVVVALLVSAAWRVATLVFATPATWLDWGPSRWFEWCLGALAAEHHCQGRKLHPLCFDARLAGGLFLAAACLGQGSLWSDPLYGGAYFILLNLVCRQEREQRLPTAAFNRLCQVGLWSYSLYLVHQPLLNLVRGLLMLAHLDANVLAQYVLLPVAVLTEAWLFFVVVERRFLEARVAYAEPGQGRTWAGHARI